MVRRLSRGQLSAADRAPEPRSLEAHRSRKLNDLRPSMIDNNKALANPPGRRARNTTIGSAFDVRSCHQKEYIVLSKPIPTVPVAGEESVWDFPRPPRLEHVQKHVEIVFAGTLIVNAAECFRVLETSHPPVYYISPGYISRGVLAAAAGSSVCEWKGRADYFDVVANGQRASRAAWRYAAPTSSFAAIAGFIAFYAGPMDHCAVGGERVLAQPGGFYGGWITSGIVGPFKGEQGSSGW